MANSSPIRCAFEKPLFVFARELPPAVVGTTCFSNRSESQPPFGQILTLLWERLNWLDGHSEKGLSKREAYETREFGHFDLWKKAGTTRLILRPESADLYGYVVIRNAPSDYFFRRSKSCKEEGLNITSGCYKRCDHRVEAKTSPNFDLLSESGAVMLLHLTLAGAGYKVFPRRTCEDSFEL
jgi:hypothetical protein